MRPTMPRLRMGLEVICEVEKSIITFQTISEHYRAHSGIAVWRRTLVVKLTWELVSGRMAHWRSARTSTGKCIIQIEALLSY